MKILAHRGIHVNALENSLESFEAAAQAVVDGVELDIRLTADNEVIVFHDDDLKRLFENDGRIDALTFDEINTITASEGVVVPKLSDVLELMKDRIVNIEIKEMKVVKPLLELLDGLAVNMEQLIFSSFIHESLTEIRNTFETAKVGLLIGEEAQKSSDPLAYLTQKISEYKPYSLHLPIQVFQILPGKQMEEMIIGQLKMAKQQMGLQYAWWTVNKDEDADFLLKNAEIADYIITDDVAMISDKLTMRD